MHWSKQCNLALHAVCGKETIKMPFSRQPQTECFCPCICFLPPHFFYTFYNAFAMSEISCSGQVLRRNLKALKLFLFFYDILHEQNMQILLICDVEFGECSDHFLFHGRFTDNEFVAEFLVGGIVLQIKHDEFYLPLCQTEVGKMDDFSLRRKF